MKEDSVTFRKKLNKSGYCSITYKNTFIYGFRYSSVADRNKKLAKKIAYLRVSVDNLYITVSPNTN